MPFSFPTAAVGRMNCLGHEQAGLAWSVRCPLLDSCVLYTWAPMSILSSTHSSNPLYYPTESHTADSPLYTLSHFHDSVISRDKKTLADLRQAGYLTIAIPLGDFA